MMDLKYGAVLLSLALLSALALPVLAAEPDTPAVELPVVEQPVEALPGETPSAADEGPAQGEQSALPHSELYYGTVTAIGRDEAGAPVHLVLTSVAYGDYVMNLSADTVWVDCASKAPSDPSTLKEGESVYVFHSPVSTRSLPPQSAAYAVVRNIPQDSVGAHYHVVEQTEKLTDGSVRIITDRGGLYLSADGKTALSRYDEDAAPALDQVQEGDRIMAWYEAVAESYPARAYVKTLMVLPGRDETIPRLPAEGESLNISLEGRVIQPTGRYERGTAVIPVAAVAQALGYEVTYTPRPEGALVTVESDSFQVRLDMGTGLISGVTKLAGAVGMTGPQDYGVTPYIVAPGTTWAPARLFELLGRTVTLEGNLLTIR